ncbi:hypothetical protein [Nodularia sp. LEGE 04288]|uniref:hypothetical protein n=1 Tax=Nodularia sp. LEGE 04288 TaxID=1828639 RepID=UPI001D129343|nr:hypothetical protein [Nodularia sp. LEGE 04288]MCC2692838.1 hypothetical protein [Nodularia sp. LEGE 04288]
MTLEFKHFDTRLNQWIHTDGDSKNPDSILTEKLDNTLLESYFPGKDFSFGHIDEYSKAEDLQNHPDGHVLLLSSKTRLLYGEPECLEVIEKLCPDRKDRGAYGSIFLGSCKDSINEKLNVLVVDDSTGENGGVIEDKVAWKLVGDCYGQISTELYDKVTKREEQQDKTYRVIQHRFGWKEGDGEDTKYRFGKGTLRPYKLNIIEYANLNNKPKIDLIIPVSSFKGTDKDNPDRPSKPQIKPGLYQQNIWLGEKAQSEKGKTAISQLLASFPQGIKDFAEELELQAQQLAEVQDDPRKVAELYCEKYEKRKAFTEEQKASIQQEIITPEIKETFVKQLDLFSPEENQLDDEAEKEQDDSLMYKIIKSDLLGHNQLIETEKVKQELNKFIQNEWRDIAVGKTLTFDRGMIIPSKELKNGEICVPWMDEGEKVLNFRSPFLNSNGLCVSVNKHIEDRLAPDGKALKGIIVVNDEDHKRIQARLEAGEVAPIETESERQARDFDGDCIGVAQASKYPNFTAEAEYRNKPENAYSPTVKLKKQSFYREDKTQPPFEEIAIHMSDSISVGIINNQVTALEALESEIEVLNTYGTPELKSQYLDQVSHHYQSLFEQERYDKPKPIRSEYKPYMEKFVALAENPHRTPEIIQQAMDVNRQMYRSMIEEGCYQNQIAVDLFKSAKTPDMDLVRENQRYLYRDVNYIKDKKSKAAYLNTGITPKGYSPVELLISQTNKYFENSQLESRPIVQFQDLFKEVEFTPQQRFSAILAKQEFDQKFNAATAMERRRETERGPSAIIQTQQGAQLEITNLTRYGHPGIWNGQRLNIELKEISEQYRSRERPHKLMAIAQIDGEVEDGKPKYRRLGTVSQQSVEDYNLKPGMVTAGAFLKEIQPELSRGQTSLLFQQAYQSAEAFRASIPESERLSAAAAAWSISATRQDEVEDKQRDVQKKVSNFAFAAFPDEIVSRLKELQFTDMKLVTLDNEANNFKGKAWNPDEKYPIEIRASDHPQDHERYGSRLVFVQDDAGEYKEFAMLEPRTSQLPIGTKAQANIVPGETYTAIGTVEQPGKAPVEFTIREISKFSYAGREFHAEPANLSIGTVPVPNQAVKIQLDGKTLGELDADSVKQLQQVNYLKNGNQLNLKLTPIGDGNKTTTLIGESPQGNLLKINRVDVYDFKNEPFDQSEYRKVNLEIPQSKTRDAVFLDGKPLGVLHFKKDKEALKDLGVLQFGQLTEVPATLQSNFSHTFVKIDPSTVEYSEVWTKESQAFPDKRVVASPQQEMIDKSAPLLQKVKERPTFLFTTPEDKMLGIMGMVVDDHKVETVTQWLEKQDVTFTQVPAQLENKKGLAVFNLVTASIPDQTAAAMTRKFGEIIESRDEYQQKIHSLPNRPKSLKTPEQPIFKQTAISQPQTISGKPIPMNYPLIMRGESNSLPVDTCIDAMRGYGRTHTTRAYEPYKQYGFKEGDIAIASGGGKEVAFRVGKQYQITQQMMSDPTYQQQWAQMEKHSAKALPELFTGKQKVWGLQMEPLGDYVDGKIVAFPTPKIEKNDPVPINRQNINKPVTIDELRDWYKAAEKLGKPDEYKQRIVEVVNEFKQSQKLSDKAFAAMNQDTHEYQSISQITQIAQKIGSVMGKPGADGSTQVQGKVYDISFNAQQEDLTIFTKDKNIILDIKAGRLQTNQFSPEIVSFFNETNVKIDEYLNRNQQESIER